ncbi:hypothetical protein JVU11DRAFT_11680 [Chiua virens]|nr:hypothetical protein JVU11DRAFT_11680 [Chiua virens]
MMHDLGFQQHDRMLLNQDQKGPIQIGLGDSAGDVPPAYAAYDVPPPSPSPHTTHRTATRRASSATVAPSPNPVMGPSSVPPRCNSAFVSRPPVLNAGQASSASPPSFDGTPSSPGSSSLVPQRPRDRKNASWLSHLPFVSSFSAKRIRNSVLSVVSDLVVPSPRKRIKEQKSPHEILASLAETCAEHKLCLSTILQEASIAEHTPMYWAIIYDRQALLEALLVYSRPLSIQTISDIRRACLIGSNQPLFHALRVCSPPFHRTDGIQVPSVRTASDTLILGGRPLDEIFIQQMSDQGFVVIFQIPLWQKRITAIGQVSMEFIVAGRMWSVTFFSTDPSLPVAASVKSKRSMNTWHVILSLLESSAPTFFDSRLVVDPPTNTDSTQTPRPRDPAPSTTVRSRDRQPRSRSSTYDCNYNGAYPRSSRNPEASLTSEEDPSSAQPPASTSVGTPPPIFIHLGAGKRKLSCRAESGEPPSA